MYNPLPATGQPPRPAVSQHHFDQRGEPSREIDQVANDRGVDQERVRGNDLRQVDFPGYDNAQQEMIDRASFPLLQDVAEVNAWDLMNEPNLGTDDMYIYDRNGLLHSYFNFADANPNIDLETPDGWQTIYDALMAALES